MLVRYASTFVLSLFNYILLAQACSEVAARTVACESPDVEIFDGLGRISSTSSAASSSISVVSVPFDVTGDGPTMSLGLGLINWCIPFGPSIEFGRRWECSMELRADLEGIISNAPIKKEYTTHTVIESVAS